VNLAAAVLVATRDRAASTVHATGTGREPRCMHPVSAPTAARKLGTRGKTMSHHHGAASAHRTIAGLYGLGTAVIALVMLLDDESRLPLIARVLIPAMPLVPLALHLAIAYGAERCMPWARVASIVLGLLMLAGFPIGTALGVWLLINALPQWVEERRYSGSLTDGWPQPQPPPLPPQAAAQARAPAPETVA
jgi:hypothetical protein